MVNLSDNALQNLPDSFAKLTNIKDLDLSGNQLTELPEQVCSLKKLWISWCSEQYSGISEDMSNLKKLTHLDLRRNKITVLSESLQDLKSLVSLSLESNILQSFEVPNPFPKNIEELDISRNALTAIPDEITNLNNFTSS